MKEKQYLRELWPHLCAEHNDKTFELSTQYDVMFINIYKTIDELIATIKVLYIGDEAYLVITKEPENTTIFHKIEERIIP